MAPIKVVIADPERASVTAVPFFLSTIITIFTFNPHSVTVLSNRNCFSSGSEDVPREKVKSNASFVMLFLTK